jgi:hypothetical protein
LIFAIHCSGGDTNDDDDDDDDDDDVDDDVDDVNKWTACGYYQPSSLL